MGNIALPQPQGIALERPLDESPMPGGWSFPQRLLFRFCFCYFVLYTGPEPGRVSLASVIPGLGYLTRFYVNWWHALAPWVAIHIFHLSGQPTTYFRTGSGDTTLAYIQNLCYVVLAALATLLWSGLDRKRRDYRTLHFWLRILLRYTLAVTMFGYGFAKVFPLQFQFPGLTRMIEPFGDFSPMGVLWSFMGASPAYTMFSGAVEVVGGALLLFRRTTALGAMVSCGALLNIAMLNFCYDVPVKLYSTNLLLMGLFLLIPDLLRLANVLVLNRPAPAADLGGVFFPRRWMRLSALGLKVLFIGYLVYSQVYGGWTSYKQVKNPKRPPLYGLWDVEKFTRNGADLPPLITDASRWKKVAIQNPAGLSVRMMNDAPRGYSTEYNETQNIVTLTLGQNKSVWTYSQPDPERVVLDGKLDNDSLSVTLRKIDTGKLLLVNRGFHWINEFPFNR